MKVNVRYIFKQFLSSGTPIFQISLLVASVCGSKMHGDPEAGKIILFQPGISVRLGLLYALQPKQPKQHSPTVNVEGS